jgi:hypothetical protein
VTSDRGYTVEDFLEAITSQLDRTQDALRLKSVTRPLTYAIRDFSMELKVFVRLTPDGTVIFQPAASDDAGASVVHIGFTTVNRTMIEENTVSLSAVKSPTLDELGLDQEEQRKLARLGVRNAEQLDELKRSTSESTVSRYSGLPVSRLRQALAQGQPVVQAVRPLPAEPATPSPVPPMAGPLRPSEPVPRPRLPGLERAPAAGDGVTQHDTDAGAVQVTVPPGTRRLVVGGRRIDETARGARLGGRSLPMRPVDDGVELELGPDPSDGPLEIDLGRHGTVAMALTFEPGLAPQPIDPWRTP